MLCGELQQELLRAHVSESAELGGGCGGTAESLGQSASP